MDRFIDYVNQNQGIATTLAALLAFSASLALAVITFMYTRYTKRLAEAASDTHVHAWVFPRLSNVLYLRIGNSGPGAALDVRTEARFSETQRTLKWSWPLLAAGEVHTFPFPSSSGEGNAHYLPDVKALGQMTFTAEYKTADGRKMKSKNMVKIAEAIESAEEANMLWTEDEPEMLPISIRNEIRGLRKSIEKIEKKIRTARRAPPAG